VSEIKKLLKQVCFFKPLSDYTLDELLRSSKKITVKKRGMVVVEHQPLALIYFVKSGSLKVFNQSPDGEECIQQLVYPGGIVGATESLFMETYPFSVQALEETHLIGIRAKTFVDLTRKHRLLYQSCYSCVHSKFNSLQKSHQDLMKRTVEERLASVLSALGGKKYFTLPKSRTLADFIGCEPETILRTLSYFRKTGVIQYRDHTCKIVPAKWEEKFGKAEIDFFCEICPSPNMDLEGRQKGKQPAQMGSDRYPRIFL
jgi:CRP/FNR family transcriptional regulator